MLLGIPNLSLDILHHLQWYSPLNHLKTATNREKVIRATQPNNLSSQFTCGNSTFEIRATVSKNEQIVYHINNQPLQPIFQ